MAIRIYEQRYTCRWETEPHIAEFPGSALRGALGQCLKKNSCLFPGDECHHCIVKKHCIYNWIFETEKYKGNHRVNARPHPYIPRFSNKMVHAGIGETWEFSMLLIDRALDWLPEITSVIELMGHKGIGKGVNRGHGRFKLLETQTIRLGENGTLFLENTPQASYDQITITLQTPLRLKARNTLQKSIDFQGLVRLMLRRIAALEAVYGDGEPDLDYSGLVNRAKRVKTLHSTICWKDMKRYSSRQRKLVPMGGLVGDAVFEGKLNEFVPLLRYAEQVHLGKQTVYGLGRLNCEYRVNDIYRKKVSEEGKYVHSVC